MQNDGLCDGVIGDELTHILIPLPPLSRISDDTHKHSRFFTSSVIGLKTNMRPIADLLVLLPSPPLPLRESNKLQL